MILAYVVAGVSFAAMALYGLRTGHLLVGSNWPDRIMRFAIVALLGFIAVAFLDVAQREQTLIWRQWGPFVCLVVITVAGLWPRHRRSRESR